MKVIRVELSQDHNWYLLGDTHDGTEAQLKPAVDTFINHAKEDPLAIVAHLGDCTEARAVSHKFYNLTVDRKILTPQEQAEEFALRFRPIKNKIKVVLLGNHDLFNLHYGNFVEQTICKNLECEYGTYNCVVEVYTKKFKSLQYKIFMTHGRKTIRSNARDPHKKLGNERAQLMDRLMNKASDCILMVRGHTHRLVIAKPMRSLYIHNDSMADEGHRVKSSYTQVHDQTSEYIDPDLRWYISLPGFVRHYVEGSSSYGEYLDLDPLDIGYVKVSVRKSMITSVEPVILG